MEPLRMKDDQYSGNRSAWRSPSCQHKLKQHTVTQRTHQHVRLRLARQRNFQRHDVAQHLVQALAHLRQHRTAAVPAVS